MKAAMLLAQRIVGDAVRDRLTPGDRLLSERAMLLRYGVGRGTLREALRFLELQGFLEVRQGARGGPVISPPGPTALTTSLSLILQLDGAGVRAILDVRVALEPVAAGLAAVNMPRDDVAELGASLRRMRNLVDDSERFIAEDAHFHALVANGSGNPLLGLLVAALIHLPDGGMFHVDCPLQRRTMVLEAHAGVAQAIAEGSAANAAQAMSHHLERHMVRAFDNDSAEVLDAPVSWLLPARNLGPSRAT